MASFRYTVFTNTDSDLEIGSALVHVPNISHFQVYQTATGDRGAQLPAAVFLSIPAEVVAVSARHLVSTWSLRIEVAFADVS